MLARQAAGRRDR